MKCFYINLDNATDRRNCIEENFSSLKKDNWELIRFPAIDITYVKNNNISGRLRPEEKACFISHRELIKSQLHDYDDIFILEDDAKIGVHSCQLIEKFIIELKKNNTEWDILYTDLAITSVKSVHKLLNNNGEMILYNLFDENPEDLSFAGSTAYIINGKSKEKIFNILNTTELNSPYDLYLRRQIYNNKIKAFFAFPFITSLTNYSDISQIQNQNQAIDGILYNYFRKITWFEQDIETSKFILNKINELEYDQSDSWYKQYIHILNTIMQSKL